MSFTSCSTVRHAFVTTKSCPWTSGCMFPFHIKPALFSKSCGRNEQSSDSTMSIFLYGPWSDCPCDDCAIGKALQHSIHTVRISSGPGRCAVQRA
eukprot:293492-Pleurochrysis_carterae.AAC.1